MMKIFDFVNQIISNISLHTIVKRKVKSKEINILSMIFAEFKTYSEKNQNSVITEKNCI